jgi:hypothetical protein
MSGAVPQLPLYATVAWTGEASEAGILKGCAARARCVCTVTTDGEQLGCG